MELVRPWAILSPMLRESQAIYVDFDDVLCETAKAFLVVLQEKFGKTVEFEDIVDFDLGHSFDLSRSDLARFFELAHEEEVLAAFEPLEGALETICGWKECGFEIEIVTGRPPNTRAPSEVWLSKHEVAYDDLIFVDKYGHAPGGVPLESLLERDYAWVVEDSFDVAERLASAGHRVRLLDRPWNRLRSKTEGRLIRCADWEEVRRSVER